LNPPIPGVHGPTGFLLLLLSIAVLTVAFDRGRYWLLWWRRRRSRGHSWEEALRQGAVQADQLLEDWDLEMRFGEALLRAAAVLGPLLGLIGTVIGLMRVLASLGPQLVLPPGASLAGYGQVLMSTALGLIVSLIASAVLFTNEILRDWQLGALERSRRRSAALPDPVR
jgi:biopolymer transport protein ExbB